MAEAAAATITYGLTPYGFVRMRLPEIRQAIVADLTARLRAAGITGNIETRPDSVSGLLIDTFADREAALWEQAEAVYLAMYPMSATGTSLDNAVSFTGVRRLTAERSQCWVVCYGAAGTVVPVSAQIRHRDTQTVWELASDVTITPGGAADVTIVPTVTANTTYIVTINGTAYQYTSDATPTIAEILAGLVAAVTASGLHVSSDGAALRVWGDGRQAYQFLISAGLAYSQIGSPVLAQTVDPMAEASLPGALNGVITTTSGWTAVNNLQAGTVGRTTETDAELRRRYSQGVYRLGAATYPSIAPNIFDKVLGAVAVKVFENDADTPDTEGRLPHSIQVVVDGGLDNDIAQAIFETKAAGIDTNGATLVQVTDADGGKHPIRFDRPAPIYVWVSAKLTLLPASEQAFPADGFNQVAENLLVKGLTQQIGQDVLIQQYYCAVYDVPGIASVDLKFAHSSNPAFQPAAGDFTAANITIADYEVGKFDLSRIQVT